MMTNVDEGVKQGGINGHLQFGSWAVVQSQPGTVWLCHLPTPPSYTTLEHD